MEKYDIVKSKSNQYEHIVYATSWHNPLYHLDEIAESIGTMVNPSKKCHILFDILLSNGNNFNRFALGFFDGEKIEGESLEVFQINDKKNLKEINSYYKTHRAYLPNGILPLTQIMQYAT